MRTIVLVPAYNPEERLLDLVRDLRETIPDAPVVVIDDGSDASCHDLFRRLEQEEGCSVCYHGRNLGKGAALKTGISFASQFFPDAIGYVTADADGQHRPEDIRKVSEALWKHPHSLILGVRDLLGSHVPKKSRYGNRITSRVFTWITGVACPDTQTGLRGIPGAYEDMVLRIQGNRYEYEMNVLVELAQRRIPFHMVPIQTVYTDNNRGSHFRPLQDSLLIYGNILRFAVSSLLSALLDIGLFTLLCTFFSPSSASRVLLLTAGARIASGLFNYAMNRYWVFANRGKPAETGFKYAGLFVAQMLASGLLVWGLSILPLPLPLIKALVDGGLFFGSYLIQRRFIFRDSPRDGSFVRGSFVDGGRKRELL